MRSHHVWWYPTTKRRDFWLRAGHWFRTKRMLKQRKAQWAVILKMEDL